MHSQLAPIDAWMNERSIDDDLCTLRVDNIIIIISLWNLMLALFLAWNDRKKIFLNKELIIEILIIFL